jgi:hypothetical protein
MGRKGTGFTTPFDTESSNKSQYSDPQNAVLQQAVTDILAKAAIRPVTNLNSPGFYYRLFLVP